MNGNPFIWTAALTLLGAAISGAGEVLPIVHNDPVAVRVVSGRDGEPQARARVVLVAGYDRRDLELGLWREEKLTDAEGVVRLSNALRNLPLLRVNVLKRHGCAADAGAQAVSVEQIRRDGLSASNRCGFAMVKDSPGVLTVFVKGGKSAAKSVKNSRPSPTQTSAK
jgi:hypothetical protein